MLRLALRRRSRSARTDRVPGAVASATVSGGADIGFTFQFVTARVTCLQVGDSSTMERLVDTQARECGYPQVLREPGEGREHGHLIWLIFPR